MLIFPVCPAGSFIDLIVGKLAATLVSLIMMQFLKQLWFRVRHHVSIWRLMRKEDPVSNELASRATSGGIPTHTSVAVDWISP